MSGRLEVKGNGLAGRLGQQATLNKGGTQEEIIGTLVFYPKGYAIDPRGSENGLVEPIRTGDVVGLRVGIGMSNVKHPFFRHYRFAG